jgi:hypothetical protein
VAGPVVLLSWRRRGRGACRPRKRCAHPPEFRMVSRSSWVGSVIVACELAVRSAMVAGWLCRTPLGDGSGSGLRGRCGRNLVRRLTLLPWPSCASVETLVTRARAVSASGGWAGTSLIEMPAILRAVWYRMLLRGAGDPGGPGVLGGGVAAPVLRSCSRSWRFFLRPPLLWIGGSGSNPGTPGGWPASGGRQSAR